MQERVCLTEAIRKMRLRRPRKCMSIQNVTIVTFICLFLLSLVTIEKLVLNNWQSSITKETAGMSEKMNHDTIEKVNSFFRVPVTANELGKKLIENKTINFIDEKSRNSFFLGILNSYEKEIYSFVYASVDGEYYGALRNKKGELELIKNNDETGGESLHYAVNADLTAGALIQNTGSFDPRLQEWYQAAKTERGPSFSPVYKDLIVNDLAVSVSCPVYDEEGKLMGVLGAHILLSDIGDYLKNEAAGSNGYVSVIEVGTRYLIANSMGEENYTIARGGALKRNTINGLSLPAAKNSYEKYLKSHEEEFALKIGDADWYANVQKYRKTGLDWVIISVIPGSLLTAELNRNIGVSAELAVIAGILSIGIFSLIIRRLYKPINGLLAIAENISAGNLGQRVEIVRNDEIGRISNVFNRLADNLLDMVKHLECIVEMRTRELNKANEILKESQSQLQLILDTAAEAIFGTDLNGCCTFCNKSCLRLLGYAKPEELLGIDMWSALGCGGQSGEASLNGKQFFADFLSSDKAGGEKTGVLKRADGTCFDAEYRALPQLREGEHVGYVITFADITERKKGEEKIRFLSYHDPLTELVNRRCFEQEMKQADTQQNHPVSLIFLDLNGLKLINDTFGHTAGDEFIVKVAKVLKNNCREGDVAARIGGDEFTVLLPRTSREEAEVIAAGIKNQIAGEKVNMVSCSVAVGIATKIKHWQKIERILETAENEMYKEKSISSINFGIHAINGIITSLHMKSPWEKMHSEEVSKLCEKIGMAMELPETEIKKLRDGAYLHDIGKITLSESILEKTPEQLTEVESEMMRQHPAIGYRILNLSQETLDLANGVYGHHECWDGSGYPKGLKGEEIPLISRILSVAEAYERILNREKDRKAGMEKALQAISMASGQKYDPAIAELFISIMVEDK
jgi:diguanylate cyclase (GGDEF)-like protein/PAS domain S-box-containing protein/putative nucleotidyltransferase with HDIG domain